MCCVGGWHLGSVIRYLGEGSHTHTCTGGSGTGSRSSEPCAALPSPARLATPAPVLEAKIRSGDSGLGWAVGAQPQPHSDWPHSGEWRWGCGTARERVGKDLP